MARPGVIAASTSLREKRVRRQGLIPMESPLNTGPAGLFLDLFRFLCYFLGR